MVGFRAHAVYMSCELLPDLGVEFLHLIFVDLRLLPVDLFKQVGCAIQKSLACLPIICSSEKRLRFISVSYLKKQTNPRSPIIKGSTSEHVIS